MRRTRASLKKAQNVQPDECEIEIKRPKKTAKTEAKASEDDSMSSDSDLDNYLKKPEELNLKSKFFQKIEPALKTSTVKENAEKKCEIMETLSDNDSESNDEEEQSESKASTSKADTDSVENSSPDQSVSTFDQIYRHNSELESAKKQFEEYLVRKEVDKATLDVDSLLALGENSKDPGSQFHPSDFLSGSESEAEAWEEVKESKVAKTIVPKEGIEITLNAPEIVRKKKTLDLMQVLKRRINRIKKENQVYIHKVHILCWIAHGNYVNSILNKENVMALALSLIPSQTSFPPAKSDSNYLNQYAKWFHKTIKISNSSSNSGGDNSLNLEETLLSEIGKKEASSYKTYVFIFVALLRALGLQCRVVYNLRLVSLKPSARELCSLKQGPSKGTKKVIKKPVSTQGKKEIVNKKSTSIKNKKIDEGLKSTGKALKNIQKVPKNTGEVLKNTSKVPKNISEVLKSSKTVSKVSKKAETSTKNNINKEPSSKIPQKALNLKALRIVLKDSQSPKLKSLEKVEAETPNSVTRKSSRISNQKDTKLSSQTPTKSSQTPKNKDSAKAKQPAEVKNKSKRASTLKNTTKLPQVDGTVDSDSSEESSSDLQQTNTSISSSKSEISKPNLKALKTPSATKCEVKDHGTRYKNSKSNNSTSKMDNEELEKKSPFKENTPNLRNLRNSATSSGSTTKKPNKRHSSVASHFNSPKQARDLSPEDKIIEKKRIRSVRAKPVDYKGSFAGEDNDTDSDFEPTPVIRRKPLETESPRMSIDSVGSTSKKKKKKSSNGVFETKVKRRIPPRSQLELKVFSSDDDEDIEETAKEDNGINIWAEVFLEKEGKWISVDAVHGHVDCATKIYKTLSQPVSYIFSWDQTDRIKDVTKRYCPDWNTVTRKLRTDAKWVEQTLRPFIGIKLPPDYKEDEDLEMQQMQKPLPKTISEFKDHPLYVLQRHLLKFQALYPPEPAILGYIRKEPVYSRSCVYTLHSRDIWLKHAKVVRKGEKPYKVVTARPKYDKLSNSMIAGGLLDVFGEWQVEDYDPPTAENGIVPRNAYGNVDLFKESMLPKKTVHLRLPGLNKTARKLNIDCAPAVIGFDFHSGWSHPTFDGFVVCEEFEDKLLDAWNREQEELDKKESEKYEKRVFGNWRRLIKAALIRERLKVKYNFGNEPEEEKIEEPPKKKRPKFTKRR